MTLAVADDRLVDVTIPTNLTQEDFDQFVDVDKYAEVVGELSNAGLLEAVTEVKKPKLEASDFDDEGEPRIAEKMQMVDYLRRFVQESAMHAAFSLVREIEKIVNDEAESAIKLKTLYSYFC